MRTWNPWHGCHKISEGCQHCYMYHIDRQWGRDSTAITKNRSAFRYPLRKHRDGTPYVHPGEFLNVCLSSDFFIEEADPWRQEAWETMAQRPDAAFSLLTKRIYRAGACLPPGWGDGWGNIQIGVSAENQARADERVPLLLDLPAKHYWVMCAPLVGPVNLSPYLSTGKLERVIAGGENYDGCRPCRHEWVQSLHDQCVRYDVQFCFMETGTYYVKDRIMYKIQGRHRQGCQALLSGLNYPGKQIEFSLHMPDGEPIPEHLRHQPKFHPVTCATCSMAFICNGCDGCGNCCC